MRPANRRNVPDSPDFWGSDGFSFKDVLDTINPLQHIPIVSTIYQSITGDVPSSGANIAGGALIRRAAIGFAASVLPMKSSKPKPAWASAAICMAAHARRAGSATQVAQNTPALRRLAALSANQRAAYNAYVKTQQNISAGAQCWWLGKILCTLHQHYHFLSPNNALPIRTQVDPIRTAVSKSLLMPMLSSFSPFFCAMARSRAKCGAGGC